MRNNKTLLFSALIGMSLTFFGCSIPRQNSQAETEHLKRIDQLIEQNNKALDIISKMADSSSRPQPEQAPQTIPQMTKEPSLQAQSQIEGRIRSIGSDTMDRLMSYWEQDFRATHPNVFFHHQGHGSSTAIPALLEGKAEFGPMSRKPKTEEIDRFKAQFGYEPSLIRVAVDAVAVYVHPDNPFAQQGLTLEQLDAIFSESCLRGGKKAKTWGDLGLVGIWENAPINVYSRNSASGTYAFFKSTVLTKEGEYGKHCKILPGSEELVKSIALDRFGIGYSGIGYKNDSVAVVPLSEKSSSEVFPPDMQYAYSGDYPLSRFLYIAINKNPATPLKPLQREFVEYIFGKEGQQQVINDGFFPVSSKIILEEKTKLGM